MRECTLCGEKTNNLTFCDSCWDAVDKQDEKEKPSVL